MRRPRGPGGRFLTADEIAAQKAAQATQEGNESDNSQPENGTSNQEGHPTSVSPQADRSSANAGPRRTLQPSGQAHKKTGAGDVDPSLLSLTEEHDAKPSVSSQHPGIYLPPNFVGVYHITTYFITPRVKSLLFPTDTGMNDVVTLSEPYSPQQQQHSSAGAQSESSDDGQPGRPSQLHHVPHPHSHHSHSHPRRTHMHSQAPRSEGGGLYTPFDMPVPVEISLMSADQAQGQVTNGSAAGGLAGMNGMGVQVNGIGMIDLTSAGATDGVGMGVGGQPAPGEVRVTSGMPLTASAQADLQRRTDEILAFSARSMGSAGGGESGR